jgi:photosystem II stability/assembly factor-like uncharacterized protein
MRTPRRGNDLRPPSDIPYYSHRLRLNHRNCSLGGDDFFGAMMRPLKTGFLFVPVCCFFAAAAPLQSSRLQASQTTADLRGLSVVDKSIVWASGTGGSYTITTDGGSSWNPGAVPGASELDFRDVQAVNASTAYLLSAGPGPASKIYKTTDGGKQWVSQYTNPDKDGFFDAISFWDADHGIVLGDPVGGRFVILLTSDGGSTWTRIAAANIPGSIPNEGAFAASGTCLAVQGTANAWFGTGGGKVARVFRSTDKGRSWKVSETPLAGGVASAGVFSIAFHDARHGIAVGGDYKTPDSPKDNVALTADGGTTWRLMATAARPGGYRSAVAYVPGTNGRTLYATGPSGTDRSTDGGSSWSKLDSAGFNSIGFAIPESGWAAGPGGRIAKFDER